MNLIAEEIEDYALKHSDEPSALCQELYEFTQKNVPMSQMLIGPLVMSFVGSILALSKAKRVLEIGTFTGYSALAMAERLPTGGEVVTLDINRETTDIGVSFWKRSPHGNKISLLIGPALESLQKVKAPFDFVLIDADKANYRSYFERSLEMLSPKGCIVFDNVLWSGKVVDTKINDSDTSALRQLAQTIKGREDLYKTLLPIRDGLLFVQKK